MAVNPELIAILVGGIVIFLGLIIMSLRRRKIIELEKRIQVDREQVAIRQAIKQLEIEESILKKEDSLSWLEKKKRELEQSGTNITLPVYLTILVASSLLIFFVVYKILGIVFFALPFALLGFYFPEKLVKVKLEKNVKHFNDELIKALRRMASVMRSGGSLKQALDDVSRSRSMPTAIRMEFSKVLSDMEYGLAIEEALYKLYERTGSKDVQFLAIAVEIQRQLGGNIAQTFDTIGATISNRRLMESEVKATLSQINATSNILSAMPFAIGGLIYVISPDYFEPLFESLVGRFVFLVCIMFICVGVVVIKKMSKIEL